MMPSRMAMAAGVKRFAIVGDRTTVKAEVA